MIVRFIKNCKFSIRPAFTATVTAVGNENGIADFIPAFNATTAAEIEVESRILQLPVNYVYNRVNNELYTIFIRAYPRFFLLGKYVMLCYVVGSRRLMPPDALQLKVYCTNTGL